MKGKKEGFGQFEWAGYKKTFVFNFLALYIAIILYKQMEESIQEIGRMENNMESVLIQIMIRLKEKENGLKERELDGWILIKMNENLKNMNINAN